MSIPKDEARQLPDGSFEARRARISVRTRVSLDAARALAAVYVVLHHVTWSHEAPPAIRTVFGFGQEAVVLFFLLSGFVIFANEQDKLRTPGPYFLRRIRRVYPTLIAALIVSTIIEMMNGTLARQFSVTELIGTLVGVQDIGFLKPGVITDPYLGNDPLWSLSYEVAFYAVFPVVMRAWRRSQVATVNLIGLASAVGYASFLIMPNHFSLVAAYLILWWVGALLAHLYLSGRAALKLFWLGEAWLGATLIIACAGVLLEGYKGLGYFPVLTLRHFAFATVVGLLALTPITTYVIAVSWRVRHLATWVAAMSYELYVLHYPMLVRWHVSDTAWGLCLATALLVSASWILPRLVDLVVPPAPRG